MSKTIIVSNRLPVKISHAETGYQIQPSEGGLATGLAAVHEQGENLWIGWPGLPVEQLGKTDYFTNELKKKRLVPLFLNEQEIEGFYEGFSNEVLWPIFHYISTYANYDLQNWEIYQSVNEKFRDTVLRYAEPDDTIWIHDYQLLLLPGLLREALPEATIAFFQHIPFPSQELFRHIPWRRELLQGMLGADLLGFHTFDDVRHFISSATRIIGVHNRASQLEVDGRAVFAEPFPMGTDSHRFSSLTEEESVKKRIADLKENFEGQTLMVSIDRLDYSKGILQRLYAYELFLHENPRFHKRIVLYMVVVPSRDTVPEYQRLKEEIDRLVGNINAEFGAFDWYPIAYLYHSYPASEIAALYAAAEVCLVTPLRDGMNLVCKEYIACKNDLSGVLILSEMAGASHELVDALMVNPNNIHEIAQAMITALDMPPAEKSRRMEALRTIVFKFNVYHWAKLFMGRLHEVRTLQRLSKTRLVGNQIERTMVSQYQHSTDRLLLLDYDGTLVGFKNDVDKASPDRELNELLDTLTSDPYNHVVIISGRKHETLTNWFGDKNITLIAEHGVWTRMVGDNWRSRQGLSSNWKAEVKVLMETYTDRTPGSFVEDKSYSLAWHYRKVAKGLGVMRADELKESLRDFSSAYGLQLLDGNKVIELRHAEVNKGRATQDILVQHKYDFILAVGDDMTDEDTFAALPSGAFTVKVGTDLSSARFYVEKRTKVRDLLRQFADLSAAQKK